MFWDPPREIFTIPYLNRPLAWYGVLFAVGIWLAFQAMLVIYRGVLKRSGVECDAKGEAKVFCEKLAFYLIIGTIVGAKVGHVLFYEPWAMIKSDPWMFVRFWEEGLASHGAVVGILAGLGLFCRKMKCNMVRLIDYLAIPACIAAGFIRLGNFVNQEILGKATSMPWGVVFGHPIDGSYPIARHPVQLYEAVVYFVSALILCFVWRKRPKQGKMAGLMFLLIFASRFLLEFLKEKQSALIGFDAFLSMGQWLSLPFIAAGAFLWASSTWQNKGDRGRNCKSSRIDRGQTR